MESELLALEVEEGVGGGGVALARLTDRADDSHPAAAAADRHGASRNGIERPHLAGRRLEEEHLPVHVAGERPGKAGGVGTLLRKPGVVDVLPALRRRRRGVHEAERL